LHYFSVILVVILAFTLNSEAFAFKIQKANESISPNVELRSESTKDKIYYPSATTIEILNTYKYKREAIPFKIEDKVFTGAKRKPRWVDINDKTVTDSTTGLMWMVKDFRFYEERAPSSWHEAKLWVKRINKLKFSGFNDWRFPEIEEMMDIYSPRNTNYAFRGKRKLGLPSVFEKGGGYWYWSAGSFRSGLAWAFGFLSGTAAVAKKDESYYYSSVRLVRKINKHN